MSGNQLMLAGAPGTVANYIEDVFSTYLYTGNGSTQTITNGIDLSGKGGLVWGKNRDASWNHYLADTAQGPGKFLSSNVTDATQSDSTSLTAFNSNGFSIGNAGAFINNNGVKYVSWTFRKAEKFFDVVTWSGNDIAGRTISHNLGSVPGCIIVKSTSLAGTNWAVYHRSLTSNQYALQLQTTGGQLLKTAYWNSTTPTSTNFTVGSDTDVNESGNSYVAYLFAHNAGGFGLSGTDDVITCSSVTTDSNGEFTVTLGWEPQWILLKERSGGNWLLVDNMRGWNVQTTSNIQRLFANLTNAESAGGQLNPTATGFKTSGSGVLNPSSVFIYIAIRRGPMETPTSGTSIYEGTVRTGTGATASISGLAFPPDLVIVRNRPANLASRFAVFDKLRGPTKYLDTSAVDSEFTVATSLTSFNQTGESFGDAGTVNGNGDSYINWQFLRAPSFFDVVCYTGTGSATTFSHNLGVAPELLIVKGRSVAANWAVGNTTIGWANYLVLNSNIEARNASSIFNSTAPTSSVFSVGTSSWTNDAGGTYVAYLFATVAGVSKVGSYAGTGTTLQVNCGFTGGSRFVLIKRTDSIGDWYVWDSARGIVAGNDPYLLLNSTAAEVTNTDYVDTYSAGFEISSTAPAAINANGGTFIFLAIA